MASLLMATEVPSHAPRKFRGSSGSVGKMSRINMRDCGGKKTEKLMHHPVYPDRLEKKRTPR